jgi:hypothetical protein
MKEIIANIPYDEYNELLTTSVETIDAFYQYKNSALGVLE